MKSFKQALEQLKQSEIFKKWQKENKQCYLSYGFVMIKDKVWRIGYFHPDNEEVSSFVIGDKVDIEPSDESFKKPGAEVKELKPDEIKISYEAALEKAKNLQKEKYSQELPMKIIMILQNHNELGNIWNITFVTKSFKTLNIKIDADSGEIKKDELIELIQFNK